MMQITKPDFSPWRAKYADDPDVLWLIDRMDSLHTIIENQEITIKNCQDTQAQLQSINEQIAAHDACPTCGQRRPPSWVKAPFN